MNSIEYKLDTGKQVHLEYDSVIGCTNKLGETISYDRGNYKGEASVKKHSRKQVIDKLRNNYNAKLDSPAEIKEKESNHTLVLGISNKQAIKLEQNVEEIDTIIETYSSSKHRPEVKCKVFNKRGIDSKVKDKKSIVKEIPIRSIVHLGGYNRKLPNNPSSIDLSLTRSEKVLYTRNTSIGTTDNLNPFGRASETLGYPYRRLHKSKTLIDSKERLEIDVITEHPIYVYASPKMKHKETKWIIDSVFATRVMQIYIGILSKARKISSRKVKIPQFQARTLKRRIKTITGSQLIEYLEKIRKLMIENQSKTLHINGLYKYNLHQLEYTINDIRKHGYIGEYKKIRARDKRLHRYKDSIVWIDSKIKLVNTTSRKKLSDRVAINVDSVTKWNMEYENQTMQTSSNNISDRFSYIA